MIIIITIIIIIGTYRWLMNDTDWIVFPRPISSARMQLRLFTHENKSQLSPSSWYGCKLRPLLKSGYFL